MKVSLFVVTYSKDAEFFKYFVASYLKYASGFCEFVVACPFWDVKLFKELLEAVPNAKVTGYEEHKKGHLKHQVENDKAEQYCTGDFIAHFDSDCLFKDKVDASDFFVDDRPVIWMEKYEDFRLNHPDRYLWRSAVIKSTGIHPEYEYMCCLPLVYPREIYPIYREWVERHTGMGFEDHVLSGKPNFPYEYADYPSIGALLHKIMPHKIFWRDNRGSYGTDKWFVQEFKTRVRQFWSHGGVTPEYKAEIDAALSKKT